MNGHAATVGCLLLCGLALGAGQMEVEVPSSELESSVLEAREALRAKSDLPWYDPDTDAVRRIEVPTDDEDDQRRHSRWSAEEATTAAGTPSRASNWFWQTMQVVAWIVLGSLLVAITWLLVWAAQRMDRGDAVAAAAADRRGAAAQRMEDLPIHLPPTDQDLLAAARACYEAGDYATAIIYAYTYQLIELDKRQLVQLAKGKTNRQYLRELYARPGLQKLLRDTMLAFEDVFFGHHPLSRLRFQQCWDNLDEFHRQLEQPA